MGMHVNAVVFFPAMTTCLLFAMYGNRVRFAHLWLHVMAMGGCYASQHLKAIGEGSLGARFGMAGATLYFAGPYLQLMHIFPLIPKRVHFGLCATGFLGNLKDYYEATYVIEDAEPDDPL